MPRLAGLAAAAVLLALSTGCSGNGTTSAESGAATGGPSASASATASTGADAAATGAAPSGPCRPTPGEDEAVAAAPVGTPSRVRLGPGREVEANARTMAISRTGTPLLVTGVVYAPDCRTPLAGATLDAWQTDATGRYGPADGSGGVTCCYLQGVVRTDQAGRYILDTIVPGRYAEGNPPPRHIHLAVGHPGAKGVVTEMEFAGEPGVAPGAPLTVTPIQAGGTQRVVFNIVLQSNR